MTDNYTKTVLSVIAAALVYLCFVLTAFPTVEAQSSKRPGESTGPADVVIVGWKNPAPLPIVTPEPIRVITERSSGMADRVVLVGWEQSSTAEKPGGARSFVALPNASGDRALPVNSR
jgi:hypothetical protein